LAEIMGNIPYMRVMVRGQYLRDQKRGHGEFVEAVAYGVRCIRGSSLWFQTALGEPYGGAHFLLPIQALCWKPCDEPEDLTYIQPWDCFSTHFGVVELDFIKRGEAYILPDRRPGQYQFTIDFSGTDLADDPEQHKSLHVCKLECGYIGAFPNNRVLMPDQAFWPLLRERPDFESLSGEYRSEGNQSIFAPKDPKQPELVLEAAE
jgi:hypothetical protein